MRRNNYLIAYLCFAMSFACMCEKDVLWSLLFQAVGVLIFTVLFWSLHDELVETKEKLKP